MKRFCKTIKKRVHQDELKCKDCDLKQWCNVYQSIKRIQERPVIGGQVVIL